MDVWCQYIVIVNMDRVDVEYYVVKIGVKIGVEKNIIIIVVVKVWFDICIVGVSEQFGQNMLMLFLVIWGGMIIMV